ncbi:MAG: hypothetical protein AB1757_25505 [Acidobacteriota bacterium]
MKTTIQENLISRYLLGDLPENEMQSLEDRFFADSETFEQVWAIENQLVDAYVRNQLRAEEKTLFEKNYLASPVHRERVAFARTLAQAVDTIDNKTSTISGHRLSWWSALLAMLRTPRWGWAMATAMLLLIAAGSWLVYERARLSEQIHQLDQAKTLEQQRAEELEKAIASERQQNDKLAAELERLRAAPPSPDKNEPLPAKPTEAPLVVSFLLTPKMLTRGGGEPQVLKLPKNASAVLLKIPVEETAARQFQVSLRTVEGLQVFSSGVIKNRAMVAVRIPADKLATADYILSLSSTTATQGAEELNRYFFRIIRQ